VSKQLPGYRHKSASSLIIDQSVTGQGFRANTKPPPPSPVDYESYVLDTLPSIEEKLDRLPTCTDWGAPDSRVVKTSVPSAPSRGGLPCRPPARCQGVEARGSRKHLGGPVADAPDGSSAGMRAAHDTIDANEALSVCLHRPR
jgi:hypothetical protein